MFVQFRITNLHKIPTRDNIILIKCMKHKMKLANGTNGRGKKKSPSCTTF